MHSTVTPALWQLIEDLAGQRVFIVYDSGKVPIDPATGLPVDSQDPANRMTASEAMAWVSAGFGVGIGFVLTEGSGYFFLDLDHARDGAAWKPYAANFLDRFPGCYIEVSRSGEGLHVLGRAHDIAAHRTRNREYQLEFYTRGRYCALTGHGAYGRITTDATAAVNDLIATFLEAGINDDVAPDWTTEPVEDWRGPADDEELIALALRAKSAAAVFGTGITFADIFTASPAYSAHYAGDASGGDQALANYLAFWTGNNCERMLPLMRRSATARPKWERADYLPRTILSACATQKTWYREQVAQVIPLPVATGVPGLPSDVTDSPQILPTVPGSLPAESLPYLGVQDAHDSLIRRFVFLRSENKYYERATRTLIGSEALNKSEASRMPKKDDGSGGMYKADDMIDRSVLKVEAVGEGYAPGYPDIYEGGKGKLVNTYHAPTYALLEPTADERELFSQYLQHLFPGRSDWLETYLDGLAYLVANPTGRLAYMTILVGERKGTGKSILMQTLPRLLFGPMNVSSPDASAVKHPFTDYLHHKRIVCFDELFEGNRQEAEERMNGRNAWITDDRSLPIHPKGQKAYEACPNVVTFFGTSNYPRTAVFLPPDDRRVSLEETHARELPEYLKERFASGFLNSDRAPGVLARILNERDVSTFNPRKRPAMTTARQAAQLASLSAIQQELLAARNDGELFRDFDTLGNVRGVLHQRGVRNAPSDSILSRELCGMFSAIGIECVKYQGRPVITGSTCNVWIWRNHATWVRAPAPALSKAHAEFKTGQ